MPSQSDTSRVADGLRSAILSGELPDGTRLPTLEALAAQHGVGIGAARQAIAKLRAERLVSTRHGSGAFVSRFALITRSSPRRLAGERWGGGEAIQDADTGPRARTVDVVVTEVPAPEFVATALGVKAEAPVLSRSRRFLVEDRPTQLATSYFVVKMVRGTPITYTDSGPGGVYARLAELGHAPVRFVERIVGRAPDPREITALALPASGAMVFEITRFAYEVSGRCIEVNVMTLDVAAYILEYEFSD